MEGLLISRSGQVQALGNVDVVDFITILQDLTAQLLQLKREKLLESLKSVATEDLVNELKSRNDNNVLD